MADPRPWIDLSARVALVTGGASGIGKSIAETLAGAGAIVLVCDQNQAGAEATARVITEASGQALAQKLDVTNQADWAAATALVTARWRRFDILVNAAGIALGDRVGDADLDVYRRTFAVNVEGALMGMSAALPFMRVSGAGAIVNVSSTAAFKGNPLMASYGASKAAIQHYSKSAALALARGTQEIRVNSVHPGLVETPMADALYGIYADVMTPEEVIARTTTGRPARPQDIADAVLFLVSDRAAFISGAALTIDRAQSA